MSEPVLFTAELEGLLREAARDPRSGLLRLPRPASVRSFYAEADERVSARAPGLSRVERHLLDVHREELALALRQLFALEIVRRPDQKGRTFWSTDERDAPRYPREEELRARIELLGERERPEDADALALLRRGLSDARGELDLLALATLAARLEPTPTARHYLARALLETRQPAAALRIAGSLVERASRRGLAFLHSTCGMALADLGLPDEAATAYSQAVQGDPREPVYLVFCLRFALIAQDEAAAARAIEGLRHTEVPRAVLASIQEMWARAPLLSNCKPTPDARRWAARVRANEDEAVRRIIDACS